jgi:excisionase family DNA binding protein
VTFPVVEEIWPTCRQVAAAKQVSLKTVYRRIEDHTLEAKRLGARSIRINPASVEAWGTDMDAVAS